MSKLRDDVRGAFDQDQARLGDIGDARHRLVQNAMVAGDAPASRGLQLAAGIAAVLIAAIVIATFALVRANNHSQVVPAATPTPMTNTLNVPDSTPIITFSDPAKPEQVDGITWDGKQSGVLPYQPVGLGNPANNLFATATEIRDRHGKLVASGNFGVKSFTGTWADDEVHFCQTVPFDNPGGNGLPTTLQIVDARVGGARNVAKIGTLNNQTYLSVAACSVQFDRAVVYQSGGQGVGVAQLWVVQLSTGKILSTRTFDLGGLPTQIVSSRDGQFIAETRAILTGNQARWTTTILGADGSPVGISYSSAVDSFSWDDSLAVVQSGGDPVTVLSVQEGRTVWTGPTNYRINVTRAQPDGSGLALWLSSVSSTRELYVIAADGRVLAHIHNTL